MHEVQLKRFNLLNCHLDSRQRTNTDRQNNPLKIRIFLDITLTDYQPFRSLSNQMRDVTFNNKE